MRPWWVAGLGAALAACGEGGGVMDGGDGAVPRDAAVDAAPECRMASDCAPRPGSMVECYGRCVYYCQAGLADCDGNMANGCELPVSSDPQNCGGCGNDCTWGVCAESQCDDPGDVEAGGAHSCLVTQVRGRVFCWGDNADGQLGDGTTERRLSPVRVAGLEGVARVVAGDRHTCSLPRDGGGRVTCWGDNSRGQLGGGPGADSPTPRAIDGVGTVQFASAGGGHTCVFGSDGSATHMRCWGANESGQLGNGTTDPVTGLVSPAVPGTLQRIAAGARHSCAVTFTESAGATEVYCWGDNASGQLGDGTRTPHPSPARVPDLTGVFTVAAGEAHTCATGPGGEVFCWGANDQGQLGDASTTDRLRPAMVVGFGDIGAQDVSLGRSHSCASDYQSLLHCWGDNGGGRLGDGTTDDRTSATMVRLLARTSTLTAGGAHTCTRVVWGEVRCWGENTTGALGDGTTEPHARPAAILIGSDL